MWVLNLLVQADKLMNIPHAINFNEKKAFLQANEMHSLLAVAPGFVCLCSVEVP